MSTTYIELEEAPEILQRKVQSELEKSDGRSKLLSVILYKSAPYIDKSIIDTSYAAYVQTANYFETYKYSICSKPEWTDKEVRRSGMIAADIIEFVNQCDWLRDGIKRE